MPTIEIISINSPRLNINQDDFEIAIIEEQKMESHRALFNEFISQFRGTILHLGNPDFKNEKDGFFFAGQITNWKFKHLNNFKFKNEYLEELKTLLYLATKSSPTNEVIFLTDIQASEDIKGKFRRYLTIDEFWENYENEGLKWNTAYLINLRPVNNLKTEVYYILWNDWDPIGVNDSEVYDDEYRSYVPKIVELLNDNVDVYKLSSHLNNLIKNSMGLTGNYDEINNKIAKLLINLKERI